MKGLLRKDLYLMIKYCRLFFILIIVFSFAGAWNNNLFFALYPITISSIIPVNLLSYDEKSNWSLYACTFPCSRKEIVSSKYILTVCTLTLSAIIVEIVQIINMIIRHNFYISGLLTTTIYLWLISLTASKELSILLLKLYNDGAIGISNTFLDSASVIKTDNQLLIRSVRFMQVESP